MGKLWDVTASPLPPCCLPSAPYTCAALSDWEHSVSMLGRVESGRKNSATWEEGTGEEKGTHACSGDHQQTGISPLGWTRLFAGLEMLLASENGSP